MEKEKEEVAEYGTEAHGLLAKKDQVKLTLKGISWMNWIEMMELQDQSGDAKNLKM